MFRLTLRELVFAIAILAIVVAWFVDRQKLNEALQVKAKADSVAATTND
jgi:hypothetical protein